MHVLLVVAVLLISMFVVAIPLHRWLLWAYAPRRYAELKSQGRFRNMPATWEELWHLWTEPEGDWLKQMRRSASMEDPRVFYGRFVDRHLMPIPYMRAICTWALWTGLILLLIWSIAWLFY